MFIRKANPHQAAGGVWSIRRRLAPMLGGDRGMLELATSLMLTMPGTPVIRYGDEIGMGEDLSLPEREAGRTPMQWSGEKNAGFTPSDEPVRPVIGRGPYGYRKVNVAMQRADAASFLGWTERMLRMRKELTEIGQGEFSILDTEPHLLAMCYRHQGRVSVFTHNLSGQKVEFRISVENGCEEAGRALVCLQSNRAVTPGEGGEYDLVLEPHGYRWFRLGGLEDMIPGDGPQADVPGQFA